MTRVTAVQDVLSAIKREIAERYRPGEYLPNERHYAERFAVSRNTVREALIYLEAYGMVEKTQRGPRVATPDVTVAFQAISQLFDRSLETCQDVIDFRRFIELGTLEKAVMRIDEDRIAALDRAVDRMERALTVHEAAEADYAFHSTLVEASGNGVVTKLYRVLEPIIVFYMEMGKSVPRHDRTTVRAHRDIIAAVRRRAPEQAHAEAAAHYEYSEGVLRETIAQVAGERRAAS